MDRNRAEWVERQLALHISQLVNADFETSGISRSSLAEQVNIARETLRRKMQSGDLTVPQLIRIAHIIGADHEAWAISIHKRLTELKASA